MAQHRGVPRPADDAVGEVFLTPRVVDQRALEEYSAGLKELIREAAGRGQSLATASADVKTLGDNLREATKELKSRLEVAVKVMPALEQRLGKAEQVLHLATDRVKLDEHLDRLIREAVAEKLAAVEKKAAAVIEAAEQRLTSVQQIAQGKLDAAVAQIDSATLAKFTETQAKLASIQGITVGQAEARVAELETRIAELSSKVQAAEQQSSAKALAIEASLDSARSRIDAALSERRATAEHTLRSAEALRAQWESALAAAETRAQAVLAAVTAQSDGVGGELKARFDAKFNEFQEIAAALTRTLTDRSSAAHQQIELKLGAGLERLRQAEAALAGRVESASVDAKQLASMQSLVARAERLLESSGEHSLSAIVGRAEDLRAAAANAATQFEEIRKQADLARQMLGDWVNTAATRIDRENERQAQLEAAIRASSSRIDAAQRTQEELTRAMTQTIELAQQTTAMVQKAAGQLGPRADEPAPDAATPTPSPTAPVPPPAQGLPAAERGLPPSVRDILGRIRDDLSR